MSNRPFDETRRTQIQALVSQCLQRQTRGLPVDEDQLQRDHADLMPELAEELEAQRLIALARKDFERANRVDDTQPVHASIPDDDEGARIAVRCPHCANSVEILADIPWSDITCVGCGNVFSLVADANHTGSTPVLKRIAHFELLERIGVGGFGTVWKARDTILDRPVALKIPRSGQLTEAEIDKFLREARAAAQLRHSGIVSVHEVGRTDETVYIVSDLVRGVSLSEWAAVHGPSPREAAEVTAQIAEALEHAHKAGIVHRDLKPGNIMVDAAGRTHIMDFGLAKRDVGEVTVTMEGQVLGTPAYMSPEQAMGLAHTSEPSTDVYSLGVVLYELLTGELPFRGNCSMLIHQVMHDDPLSPRKLNNHIPVDLETICLRCLEKDPAKRFASAGELEQELLRFLNCEPIQSRPIGSLERTVRWTQRHPTVAALMVAVVLLLIGGSSVSTYFAMRSAGFEEQAETSQRRVDAATNALGETEDFFDAGAKGLRTPFNRQLASVASCWQQNPSQALALLEDSQRCPDAYRDFLWRYLHRHCSRPHQQFVLPDEHVVAHAFNTAGDSFTCLTANGWKVDYARSPSDVWREVDRQRVEWRKSLSVSSRSQASNEIDHVIDVHDVSFEPPLVALSPNDLSVIYVSHDGTQVVRRTGEGTVSEVTVAEPSLLEGAKVHRVCAHVTDRLLLLTSQAELDPSHQKWQLLEMDLPSGASRLLLNFGSTSSINDAAWDQTCEQLLVLRDDERIERIGIKATASRSSASNGDGTPDRRIKSLWQVDERTLSQPIRGARAIAMTDEHLLVAAGRLLRFKREPFDIQRPVTLNTSTTSAQTIVVAATQAWIASIDSQGTLKFWKQGAGHGQVVGGESQPVAAVAYSNGEVQLAVAMPNELRILEGVSGAVTHSIEDTGGVVQLDWAPDDSSVAMLRDDGTISLLPLAETKLRPQLILDVPVTSLAFESKETLLVGDRQGRLFRVAISNELKALEKPLLSLNEPIRSVRVARVGQAFAVASGNHVYFCRSGTKPRKLDGHRAAVVALGISRNGGHLISLGEDGEVIRWKTNPSRPAQQQLTTRATGNAVEFSPDGKTLATLDGSRVQFWDAMSGLYRGAIGHSAPIDRIEFATQPVDGTSRLAVIDQTGQVSVWFSGEKPRVATIYPGGVVRELACVRERPELVCLTAAQQLVRIDLQFPTGQQTTWLPTPTRCLAATGRSGRLVTDSETHLQSWQPGTGGQELLAESSAVLHQPIKKICGALDRDVVVALTQDGRAWWIENELNSPVDLSRALELELANDGPITDVALSDSGDVMLLATTRQLRRLEPSSDGWRATSAFRFRQPIESIRMVVSRSGVVAGIASDRLMVWDPLLEQMQVEIQMPGVSVLAAAHEDDRLATAIDNEIQLWSLHGEKNAWSLTPDGDALDEHTGPIVALAFRCDDAQLISASEDRSVKLWPLSAAVDTQTPTPTKPPGFDQFRKMFESGDFNP